MYKLFDSIKLKVDKLTETKMKSPIYIRTYNFEKIVDIPLTLY